MTVGATRRRTDMGVSSVEYTLLVGFIAVVAAAGILALGFVVLTLIEQGRDAVPR